MTLVVLVTCAVVLAMLISSLPARRHTAHRGIDYEAMADIESHDVDDIAGGAQFTTELTFEREGGDKPVCVAESLTRVFTGGQG